MPVHPRSSATSRPPVPAPGRSSSLQHRSADHNPRKEILRTFHPNEAERPDGGRTTGAWINLQAARAAGAVFRLHEWAYCSAEIPENTERHPRSKAGMSHGINNMSQKGGLERKLECPLESTKSGLHGMPGGARSKAGIPFVINRSSS